MTRPHRHLAVALLLLLTALVYAPSLSHDFQFDDVTKIKQSPRTLDARSLWEAFLRPGYSEGATRLLPNLTYCADAALSRWITGRNGATPWLDPLRFNVTNLLIHLMAVWAVLRLGRSLRRRHGGQGDGIPLLAAAIFALHPLNSEAVLYGNARPNTMATFFYALTVVNGLRLARGAPGPWHVQGARWCAVSLTFTAALLCKELAATLAVMFPLAMAWPGHNPAELGRRRRIPFAAVLAAVGVALGVVALTGAFRGVAGRVAVDPDPSVTGGPAWRLLLNGIGQAWIVTRYLGLTLLPLPRFLSAEHGARHLHASLAPAEGDPESGAQVLLALSLASLAAWSIAAVAAVRLRRRYPVETLMVLWILVTHAPTSLIPRDEPMVEYRTYLPMAGLCLLMAHGLGAVARALQARGGAAPYRAAVRCGCVALLAALAAGTLARSPAWMSQTSFWQDVTAKMDPSRTRPWARYRAWINYGSTLADLPVPRTTEALAALDTARSIDPARWNAYAARGALFLRTGDPSAAVRDLRLAIDLNSDSTTPHADLVAALLAQQDREGAWLAIREAFVRYPERAAFHRTFVRPIRYLLERPDTADAWSALADAVEPLHLQRVAEATRRLEDCLGRHPTLAEGWLALGVCGLSEAGGESKASAAFHRVIDLDPGGPAQREALRALAEADLHAGREEAGLSRYRALLSAHPGDLPALFRLGFRLGDRPGDRVEGEALLRRAVELCPLHPLALRARKRLSP
jgi:tetratricopeptide (TPR) repeat protein